MPLLRFEGLPPEVADDAWVALAAGGSSVTGQSSTGAPSHLTGVAVRHSSVAVVGWPPRRSPCCLS